MCVCALGDLLIGYRAVGIAGSQTTVSPGVSTAAIPGADFDGDNLTIVMPAGSTTVIATVQIYDVRAHKHTNCC